MQKIFQKFFTASRNRQALAVAVTAALIGTVLLVFYMRRFEEEASGGPPVAVLIATQDIPLGTAITQQMLGVRTIPKNYVEDRHIPAADARRVIGVRVSSGVNANESVLWTDLATTSEQRRDLSSLVRNGMRAITVRADLTSSFGGLLRPGDRVDVLLTMDRDLSGKLTVPLLQNLLVLAAGRDTGGQYGRDDANREVQVNQVTLSVSVEQAQLLTFAQDQGRITLILRNPDDISVVAGLPETTAADVVESRRRILMQQRGPMKDAKDEKVIERVE